MAVTEMLRLLIDADTSGAVRGINQLGAASKRELSKAEQSAQKWGNSLTNIGAGMIALGAIGVVGLGRAAKASEEANLSVVKLENTLQNMPQLAGESSAQFIELADSIQDVTAADADQIVAAEAMLGTFRLTANEIKTITPLVVDYARKFDVDLVSAATQVGKALDGQVGALKRNGVSIDEAAFAADRFSAVQEALSEQVGGFAQAEGATFAGSLERLKNQLGDLAEGVGTGAVDAFSSMFSVVEGLTERFDELSPATQNTVGKIATFASVGLIAAGGISMLIGQVVKMHQNFTMAREAVVAFAGSGGLGRLTRMGLVIGGLIVLREALMALQDDIGDIDVATLENDLLDLAESASLTGSQLEDVLKGFGEALDSGDPQKLEAWVDQMNEVDKALASLAGRSPDKAAEAFREISSALQDQGATAEQVKGFFDDYAAAVANADTSSRIAADGVGEFGGAMAEGAEDTEDATSALQDYSDTLQAMTDPVFAAMDAITGVRDAQVGLAEAERGVLESQVALNEAIDKHGRNSAEAAEAALALEDAERGLSDAQWATVQSAAEADSALAGLQDAVVNGDVSVDAFKDTLGQWVRQGFLTMEQAADAAREVEGLADEASDADKERVEIPVSAPGATDSRTRLRNVRDAAHSIPSRRSTSVSVSGVGFAIGQLDNLARRINSISGANVRVSVGGGGGLILHEGGIVPGPRGQEVAAVLQAGERVMSLQEVDAANRRGGAGFGGGGNNLIVNVDLRGAVVPSSVELDQIVHKAVNRGVRQGGIQLVAAGSRVEVRR